MHDGINAFSGIACFSDYDNRNVRFIHVFEDRRRAIVTQPSKMSICYSLPLCVSAEERMFVLQQIFAWRFNWAEAP